MSSKSEPPICCVEGWYPNPQRNSHQKSFHFISSAPMIDFCLSILKSDHDQSTHLLAVENPTTNDIEVEVVSSHKHPKNIQNIIIAIETCYAKSIDKGNSDEKYTPFWSKWFNSLG